MDISALFEYLNPVVWINALWEMVKDFYFWVCQSLIDALVFFMSLISLPTFNVPSISNSVPVEVLHAINWVIPFDFATICIGVIATSTVAYFTVGTLLRWAKVIG